MVETVEHYLATAKREEDLRHARDVAIDEVMRWMIAEFDLAGGNSVEAENDLPNLKRAFVEAHQQGREVPHEVPAHTGHPASAALRALPGQSLAPERFAGMMARSRAAVRKHSAGQSGVPPVGQLGEAPAVQAQQVVVRCLCPSCEAPVSVLVASTVGASIVKGEDANA